MKILYTLAMRELPAGTVSTLAIIEPLSATLFSVTLLDRALDIYSMMGILLILSAVLLLSRADDMPREKERSRYNQ